MPTKLNSEILTAAIEGFESQKLRIDSQIAGLRQMLTGSPSAAAPKPPNVKRKGFSPAVRRRMREAQKRRWAGIRKAESAAPAAPEPQKPKRRISEEGMKRIIAATKKRWAAKRAEATQAKSAPTRKAASKKAAVKKVAGRKSTAKKAPVKTAKKETKPPQETANAV